MDLEVDVDAYERDGYWIAPPLFDAIEVTAFLAATDRVINGQHDLDRSPTLVMPAHPGEHDLRKIDNAWWADSTIASLATDARLGEIAAALMRVDTVKLWQDQLLYKPPGGPQETTIGWHQDWASWSNVASHGAFVTAWVAFDDVDVENGAMQMLRGSHHWGLVEGGSNFFATDRDGQLVRLGDGRDVDPVTIDLSAGQVSFHHPLTFHGSGPNTSNRLRRSLAIHFVAGDVTAVDEPGIWQHYNLALHRERGGDVGDVYAGNDLCPVVHPA